MSIHEISCLRTDRDSTFFFIFLEKKLCKV